MRYDTNSKRFRAAPGRGFSLIEVTIALAIVSVAFISLLGLLPVGLNTFTRSVDASVQTQIAQGILTQARQSKFSELDKLLNRINFYFDDQGKPVEGKSKAIYFVDPSGSGSGGPDIKVTLKKNLNVKDPGTQSDTGNLKDAALAIISITVRKVSAPNEKSTVVAYVANNGL